MRLRKRERKLPVLERLSAVIIPPIAETRCMSESMYSLSVSFSLVSCTFDACAFATLELISAHKQASKSRASQREQGSLDTRARGDAKMAYDR